MWECYYPEEDRRTNGQKLTRELFGLFLLFWGLLLLLSLLTFNVNDPSLNHVVSGNSVVSNRAGLLGAYIAGFLNDVFGIAAYVWPLIFGALGAGYVSATFELLWWRWCGYFLLTLCLLCAGATWDWTLGDIHGGGMVGRALYDNMSVYLSPGGSSLVVFFIVLIATQLSFDISWISLSQKFWAYLKNNLNIDAVPFPKIIIALPKFKFPKCSEWTDKFISKPSKTALPPVLPHTGNDSMNDIGTIGDDRHDEMFMPAAQSCENVHPSHMPSPVAPSEAIPVAPSASLVSKPEFVEYVAPAAEKAENTAPSSKKMSLTTVVDALLPHKGKKAQVPFPSMDLLSTPAVKQTVKASREEMEHKGKILIACLADFGVQGELVRITPGPVVTMYEVRPAAGIRVSRISNLSDDLALALKAIAIRIQAPIPGSDTVGIEIPNTTRETVFLREMFEVKAFKEPTGSLLMALGKDISGQPVMADLARMPHLLVAGATGAGKSVCLNSILLGFLYKTRPEDVKLLLVDPKRIEMAVYADLPHLVHPVVTDMNQAKTALDWAVHEMDQRYEAMARLGVRNISGFNQKLLSYGANLPADLSDLERLPYLVIIIDELADLMLTAAREVETSIVRLAQLARAAGIHMILATQRPSVDVVTGLIKANFPCRISFQVTSKHDSRTILDTVGAEHLLGKGDMLFKPSGGRLQRLHAPFVSDEEVIAVVEYWKHQLPPSYRIDFAEWGSEMVVAGQSSGGDAANDPLYPEVQNFVSDQGKASISFVQRRFKIGFNRAARLVEQLERDGIIGPADGSKPRSVVR
ncbi:MAG: DNA translocase FtsK 4TM domain-containing protein [Desulfovibrionaceae bacterium]